MTVTDYVVVPGFVVDIDCYEDLSEAFDRMHEQVMSMIVMLFRWQLMCRHMSL